MAGPGCSKRQQAGHSDDAAVAVAVLLLCSADRGQEQGKRGREKERERARFDRGKLKIFELNLKSFEYQSCFSCQNLQLWFQTFSHLRLGLKVRLSKSSLNDITLNLPFLECFSNFYVVT